MTDNASTNEKFTTLHLIVNNHPGVMSHVCGLFARRAFNLEGILVTPSPKGSACNMWLLVNEDQRMPHILSQVRKLYDVLDARVIDCGAAEFEKLGQSMPC